MSISDDSVTATVPLVVDLDGTLIHSDMFFETASSHVLRAPHQMFRLASWLLSGRTRLKSELALRAELDFAELPYRLDLLSWLREERARGRQLILATGSARVLADGVAEHLRIFDDVISSDDAINLKATAKRDHLVGLFGAQGYDYVGNSRADLPVWGASRMAHVVGSERLVARASDVAAVGSVFRNNDGGVRDLVKALRPHQWVKNLLVLIPLFTAQRLGNLEDVLNALVATACFCVAASSVYVLNDIADITNDRNHPHKRYRPFAAGRLSVLSGWLLWPVLAVLALLTALAVNWQFFVVLGSYLVLTTAYTFRWKQIPVLDVVSLGLLYTIRIIAGAAAILAPLSMWLLTFSMLLFLSLALVKRVSELTRARAELTSAKGRGYRDTDLELLSSYGVASSIGAVVIFSLYVNDPVTANLYRTPEVLWTSVPVLLAWLMRCWLIAHRGEMNEDPIVFAIRDRVSLLTGALVGAAFVVAAVGLR